MKLDKKMMLLQPNKNAILPQYVYDSEGQIGDSFDSLTGWTGADVARIALNNTQYYEGTGSVKFTTTLGGTTTVTKSVNIDMSGKSKNILLSVYCHTPDNLDNVLVYLSTEENFSKYFAAFLQPNKAGWNHILFKEENWSNTGSASWSDPIVLLRVRTTANAAVVDETSIDRLFYGVEQKPVVMFNFDDGRLDTYSKAFAYMKTKLIRGTCYAVSDLIGTGGAYASAAQLQEMDAAGWSIGNHTKTHTNLTTLTQGEIETEFTTAQGVLDGLGLTKASQYVAYPYGATDDDVQAAMTATGMLTGRIVSAAALSQFTFPLNDRYLTAINFDDTVSLATAKGYVDSIVAKKRMVTFLFHVLDDTAAGASQWKTSDFQELVDYVVQQNAYCLTIDDLYKSISGSIRIPRQRK